MVEMFGLHVVDEVNDQGITALFHHREQTHLLLEHVHLERLGHDIQVIGQSRRRALALELTRQRDDARQFAAVGLVKARQDMVYQFCCR